MKRLAARLFAVFGTAALLTVGIAGAASAAATTVWTRQMGTTLGDSAKGVAVDTSGNVYVAGYTQGGLDGNTNAYPALNYSDLFVVKYDTNGVKQWTKQMGTESSDVATGVAIDTGGNVYVTGGTPRGLDGNTSAGGGDLFVVKYDTNGNKQWTRQLGTASDDYANGVAVDATGNVYAAGGTNGGLDGNAFAGGPNDFFVVKYDSSGVKQWTRQMGTTVDDYATRVVVDTSGNVYVAGSTQGGLDGNTNAGNWDGFVVKYDTNGNRQWTRQMGTTGDDYANGVAVDASGNVYAAGNTQGDLDGNANTGGRDLFVVKYDTNGNKQWTRQLGTASDDYANGVAVDASGNVYAAANTKGGLDGNTNAGGDDLFVVKYNSSGGKLWTKQMGTTSSDIAYGVSVDASGCLYIAGSTEGALDGNTNAGGMDLFVMKLGEPPTSATLTPSASSVNTGSAVTLTASASGGSGPYEYKFYHYGPATGNAWAAQTSYAASSTWNWTPSSSDAGNNWFYVLARNAGSTAEWEAWGQCAVTVNAAVPPRAALLMAATNVTFRGRPVTFRASASGGSGPYEYEFFIHGPGTGNTWVLKASFTTTSHWSWTPSSSDVGINHVLVYVRNVGSSASYEAYATRGINVRR